MRSDGNRGVLQYRQYPIEYLFANYDYEEVAYLLIWDHLPTPDEKLTFRREIAQRMVPDVSVLRVIKTFRYGL